MPARKIRTTTAATMAMCHQTLTWFSSETRVMPAMFIASWTSMRMPIVISWPFRYPPRNVVVLVYSMLKFDRIGVMIVAFRNPAAA